MVTQPSLPIIIIGAGPVGLGAALELSRFGVRSVLIEKHPGISWHPKTRNFNTRTMEIARAWGSLTYRRLRSIDTPPGWKSPIRFLETAIGEQYGLIESHGFAGPGFEVSPAEPVMSSQDLIEEIMLDQVKASGLVDIRFGTEATRLVKGAAEDDDLVEVEVTDLRTGRSETLTGAALVAADGAYSSIRSQLGLEMIGSKDLSNLVNCYFRADIEPHLDGRHGVLLFVNNEKVRGVLQPLNARGRWLSQITVDEREHSLEVFTKERARDWVRDAVGIPDLDVEILSLGLWKLNATVVDRMVVGRVLMCGDAAHQFPPTGGLGVNTGLQGMHNAMWKLALWARGEADWSLVRTYETERRPVAESITAQSLQNSMNVNRIFATARLGAEPELGTEEVLRESRRYGNHLGVEFGAAYSSLAVIPDGSTPPPVDDTYSDYIQSPTPGCRAPHVWLGQADARLSTLDLVGSAFVLIAGPAGQAWIEQANEAGAALDIRLDAYRIGSAGLDDLGGFTNMYGIADDGAVLVRPDGHIAWRIPTGPDGADELTGVLREVLGRGHTG